MHHATGRPAPRVATSTIAQPLKTGWDQADPLLATAWHPVVVEAAGTWRSCGPN